MQNRHMLQQNLERFLNHTEELLFGYADLEGLVPPAHEALKYGISIALPHRKTVVNTLVENGPTPQYYEEYQSLNRRLDEISAEIKAILLRGGFRAHAVPSSERTDPILLSGEFPHKTAAIKAGLGWIGKSALFITTRYGPRVRLATVFTDLPLVTSKILLEGKCGKCGRCAAACPAQAIKGNHWNINLPRENLLDPYKCDLWKIEHHPDFRGQVCGICLAVCPHGTHKGL